MVPHQTWVPWVWTGGETEAGRGQCWSTAAWAGLYKGLLHAGPAVGAVMRGRALLLDGFKWAVGQKCGGRLDVQPLVVAGTESST